MTTISMRAIGLIFVAAFTVGLASCSTSGGSSVSQSLGGGVASQSTGTRDVASTFSIAIPRNLPAGSARRPAYISAATLSAVVTVNPAPLTHSATTTIACTPVPNPTSCSGTVFTQPGSITFAASLFDAAGGTGKLLSQGLVTQDVTAATTAVNVSFNPVLASATLAVNPTTFLIGMPSSATLTVTALDPDGKTIVAANPAQPFIDASGNPRTLGLTISAVPSNANPVSLPGVTLPLTSVPATPLPIAYTGATFTSITIASTIGTTPSGSVTVVPAAAATPNAVATMTAAALYNMTLPYSYPTDAPAFTTNFVSSDSTIFGAPTGTLTATNSVGLQNFAPSQLTVPSAQVGVLFLTTSFSGTGSIATLPTLAGKTTDLCLSTSVAPGSATYFATYFFGSTMLGSSQSPTNSTPAVNDGFCGAGYTHLIFPVTPLGGQTFGNGTSFGIVVSHS